MEKIVLTSIFQRNLLATATATAAWTRPAGKPTRYWLGVITSCLAGAPFWPMEPSFGLMHTELGKVIPDVLAGVVSPRAGLLLVSQGYSRAAADKGFIK